MSDASGTEAKGSAEHKQSPALGRYPVIPSIAIVGTEGAGKTVFVASLIKHVQQSGQGITFDPQSAQAQLYVDRVWRKLQDQDWPPSTPAGQLPIFEWTLNLPGLAPLPFRLIDPPGHDLRRIFSADANLAEIPSELQLLASTVASSGIVILLVNLADFLGTPDGDRRRMSELAIKFVLDSLVRRQPTPRVALVFTQADRFPADLKPFVDDPWSVLKQHLPLVYQSVIHHPYYMSGGIRAFIVSAVNKTRFTVDENGVARHFPAPDFQSEGLDSLLQWLQWAAQPPRWDWEKIKPWVNAIWMSVVFLFLVRGCWSKPKFPEKKSYQPPAPKILISNARYTNQNFLDWDVEVTGQIRNDGGAGQVTVYGGLLCGDKHWKKESVNYLPAGGTSNFRLVFKEYINGKAKFAVSTASSAVNNLTEYRSVPE